MFAIGFGIGAVIGAITAKRRKGNLLDILQYGAGFGIAFGILFMIISVFVIRMS